MTHKKTKKSPSGSPSEGHKEKLPAGQKKVLVDIAEMQKQAKQERRTGEEGEMKRRERLEAEDVAKFEERERIISEGKAKGLTGGQTLAPTQTDLPETRTDEQIAAGMTINDAQEWEGTVQEWINAGGQGTGMAVTPEDVFAVTGGAGATAIRGIGGKAAAEIGAGTIKRFGGVMSLDDFASWGKNKVAKTQYADFLRQQGVGKVEIISKGASTARATKAWEAGSKVAPSKLKGMIPKTKGGKIAALVGGGIVFERTFSYQSMVFWAAADNIGTTGAMRANNLRDQATFGELDPEDYAKNKADIEALFSTAKSSMWWASLINPVTAYANYQFFGSALEASRDSTIQTFAEIDNILATKTAEDELEFIKAKQATGRE